MTRSKAEPYLARYYDVTSEGGREVLLPRTIEEIAHYLGCPPEDIEEVPVLLSKNAPAERSYVAIMGCTSRDPPLDITMIMHHDGVEQWFIPFAYGHYVVGRYEDRTDLDYTGLDDYDLAMLKKRTVRGPCGYALLTEVAQEE